MRPLYFTLGWLFFGVGFAGAFLPVLPTTPFMLVALWCFSRSSPRFHNWLYSHKFFGPPLQQWQDYRVIPLAAKILAVSFMSGALIFLHFFSDFAQWITITSTMIIAYGCWFILTKPSKPSIPDEAQALKNDEKQTKQGIGS